MNTAQAATLLRNLHAAYGTEVTDDVATLWMNVFGDSDYRSVADSVETWIKNEPRWPTPADIRATMRQAASRLGEPPALPGPSGISGPEGGFAIAYDAYCREATRRGREPKPFQEFMGKMPEQLRRRDRAAYR